MARLNLNTLRLMDCCIYNQLASIPLTTYLSSFIIILMWWLMKKHLRVIKDVNPERSLLNSKGWM